MKLYELISEHLEELGQPENKRRRAYVLAVSGLRELAFDATSFPKIVELEVSDADTAPLPLDFVNIMRMGLCGADGIIHSMTANNNLCLNQNYNDCGEPIRRQPEIATTNNSFNTPFGFAGVVGSPYVMANNYRNGELMGGFFGLGGGQNANGTYRIDMNKNQIQFGFLPLLQSRTVVLEYLSDINSVDGDFLVHPFMILAIKEWISWRWLIPTGRQGDIQSAHQRFKDARKVMWKRFNAETQQDWLSAIRKQNVAAVKF